MKKIGFNADKYIEKQSKYILKRINEEKEESWRPPPWSIV